MQMKNMLSAGIALSILAGCASSSGVLPVGPDTYMISNNRSGWRGGSEAAKSEAITSANAHCSQMGKQVMVTNVATERRREGAGSADITFQCLAEGDSDLYRPKYEKEPDTVIEDRRSR
jgi:hypothetical protein